MANSRQTIPSEASGAALKQQSFRSGLITFAAQPVKLVIGIGATAILARLVAPADFGLLAMVAPLLGLADSLSNLGMETATVQKQNLNHQQASAAFWLSLKVNAVVILLVVGMGPVLAWFYGQPALVPITFAMAAGAFGLCVSFQQSAILRRQMRFGLLTIIEVVAIVLATGCALTAAWLGWGYWALVLQVVVMQLVQGVAYWMTCDWRPSRVSTQLAAPGADGNIRDLFSYGMNLSAFRFITRIGMQMDRVLVGYISGATALGFYDVAYRWAYFPFVQVYTPLFDVVISSLSRAYAEPATYRKYCRWGLMPLFAICMPALAFLYVTATDILLILLGEQWLPAIPIFQLLVIAMYVGTLYRVTKWLYISSGQTQHQLYWGLIHTPVMIGAVAIGAHWGAYGIAMGYTVGMCLLTYPSVAFCLQRLPLTMGDFLSAVWPAAVASSSTALLLFLAQPVLVSAFENSVIRLIVEGFCYSALYCIVWILLPGGRRSTALILKNFQQLTKKQKKKQK